eukprot:222524_1
MKLQKLKFYGTMRRKVYLLPRVDEFKASDRDQFPTFGKNKCMGDIENVRTMLNESGSLNTDCKEYEFDIPHLKVQLKDYQKRGLAWLLHMENSGHDEIHGGLLCDESGLGKTVQMIALMLVQKQRNSNSQSKDRTLIITPSPSINDQWIFDLSKVAGHGTFKYINYYGNDREKVTRQQFADCDIVFTTTRTFVQSAGKPTTRYDDFRGEIWTQAPKQEIIHDAVFSRIIVDKAHDVFKNPNLKSSHVICTLAQKCHAKWCLSGRPFTNDLPYNLVGMIRFLGMKDKTYCDSLKLTATEKSNHLTLAATVSKTKRRNMWLDITNEYCRVKVCNFLRKIMLSRQKQPNQCYHDRNNDDRWCGRLVYIHSGVRVDEELSKDKYHVDLFRSSNLSSSKYPRGQILGVAIFDDTFWFDPSKHMSDPWSLGPFCYQICDSFRFERGVDASG